MSQSRQRRASTINSPQTIEENSELDISNYSNCHYRLRNPSYKHSIKTNIDMDNTELKKALKPVVSGSESDNDSDSTEQVAAVKDIQLEVANLDRDTAEMPLKAQTNTLVRPKSPMLSREDWQGKNHSHKLDTIFDSINKLYTVYDQVAQRIHPLEVAVFDKTDGILPQLQGLANYAKESDTRVDSLMKENVGLREELEIVKGILHKQSKQISALQGKQAHQTARSMADNFIINGLLGDFAEADGGDARGLVEDFLHDTLEIEYEEDQLLVVHWMGQFVRDRHHSIIIKVKPDLKKKILDNTSKLAKKTNSRGHPFSVNLQLPDKLAEQKREVRQIIKEKKDSEKDLDESRKSKILVKNNNVYINGQLQRKLLRPPTVAQIFDVSEEDRIKMKAIKIKYTQTKPLRNSEFMGAACVVNNMNEVHLAYRKLFLKYPGADHIMAGFSCAGKQGYQDDSEHSAGFRILNTIKDSRFSNVAVFIIREYGGQHLGPARFTVIKELSEEALQLIF